MRWAVPAAHAAAMNTWRLAAGGVALAIVVTAAPAMGDTVGTRDGDSIRGGPSGERIEGRAGNDRLWGGAGNDRLFGQRGRDRIWPGPGADRSRGGSASDQVFLSLDGASDRVDCGTGEDLTMYSGRRDPADSLASCERVWTQVTTPGCVTGGEWRRATVGMRKSRVHRIFENEGELRIRRNPWNFSRFYRQCRPTYEECYADLDFMVDRNGVARLAGKFWASICWSV